MKKGNYMKSEKLIRELYKIRKSEFKTMNSLNITSDVTPRLLEDLRWILNGD